MTEFKLKTSPKFPPIIHNNVVYIMLEYSSHQLTSPFLVWLKTLTSSRMSVGRTNEREAWNASSTAFSMSRKILRNDLSPAVIIDDPYSLERVQNNIIWDVCTCSMHGLLYSYLICVPVTETLRSGIHSPPPHSFSVSTYHNIPHAVHGNDYLNFHV